MYIAYVLLLQHTYVHTYVRGLGSVFGTSFIILLICILYTRTYIHMYYSSCTYVLDVSHYLLLLGVQEPLIPAILTTPERVYRCHMLHPRGHCTPCDQNMEWVVQLLCCASLVLWKEAISSTHAQMFLSVGSYTYSRCILMGPTWCDSDKGWQVCVLRRLCQTTDMSETPIA